MQSILEESLTNRQQLPPNSPTVRNCVQFQAVTKRFGNIVANDAISCTFESGGIHALLGENGAGKSTLMKILAGQYQPDTGSVLIAGRPIVLPSAAHARKVGIGMVHQQFTLVPSMSVLENVLLGDDRLPMIINKKQLLERLSCLAVTIGMSAPFNKPVALLSVAERQKVEILKLLWRDAQILILDEPTSQLAGYEAEDFLSCARVLAEEGKIVIFISHHIEEILRFASKITVLRSGKHINTVDAASVHASELAAMMIDSVSMSTVKTTGFDRCPEQPFLSLKQVSVAGSAANRSVHPFDLDLFSGEVVGIAGVDGSGQEELARILSGHLQPYSGTLVVQGKQTPWAHLRHPQFSAGYIPSDSSIATVSTMSVMENSALRDIHLPDFCPGAFLDGRAILNSCRQRIERFDLRPANPNALCGSLSGGNLQRLILSREMDRQASLLVAVNPTAGLDFAMTGRVLGEIRGLAARGAAVVLVSPDLQELLGTCDRIIVFCSGSMVGAARVEDLDQDTLALLIGGVRLELARKLTTFLQSKLDQEIDAEVREALYGLLESEHTWQRRLACQIAPHVFCLDDIDYLVTRLKKEEHPQCILMLVHTLRKLGYNHAEGIGKTDSVIAG